MQPRVVANFKVTEQLGRGGAGTVYAATDLLLDRPVAIKVLKPDLIGDTEWIKRFQSEAANLARLNHPNITTLFGLVRDGEDLMMVMELARGRTVEEFLTDIGAADEKTAMAVAKQALDGLGYAHRMGVVHRDVKPSNLMICADGMLKLMDFGIARAEGSNRLTRQGQMIGTLAYMAPEQIRGKPGDPRSDIYSFGVVLYELLTGCVPFDAADDYELMKLQMEATPPPLRNIAKRISERTEAAVLRSLAKNPDDRFADSGSFIAALPFEMGRDESAYHIEIANSFFTPSQPQPVSERQQRLSTNASPPPTVMLSSPSAALDQRDYPDVAPTAQLQGNVIERTRVSPIGLEQGVLIGVVLIAVLAVGYFTIQPFTQSPELATVTPFSHNDATRRNEQPQNETPEAHSDTVLASALPSLTDPGHSSETASSSTSPQTDDSGAEVCRGRQLPLLTVDSFVLDPRAVQPGDTIMTRIGYTSCPLTGTGESTGILSIRSLPFGVIKGMDGRQDITIQAGKGEIGTKILVPHAAQTGNYALELRFDGNQATFTERRPFRVYRSDPEPVATKSAKPLQHPIEKENATTSRQAGNVKPYSSTQKKRETKAKKYLPSTGAAGWTVKQ